MNHQKRTFLLFALFSVAMSFGFSLKAKAFIDVSPPINWPREAVYITQILGNQYVAFCNEARNSCGFTKVGNSNGLFDSVRVLPGNEGNYVEVVEQPYENISGYRFEPVKLNGWQVIIDGQGGNDFLWSSSQLGSGYIKGGDGGDVIYMRASGGDTWAQGDTGGDILISMTNGTWLEGGDHDDLLCLQTTRGRAQTAYGGPGVDISCGTASLTNWQIEGQSCSNVCSHF